MGSEPPTGQRRLSGKTVTSKERGTQVTSTESKWTSLKAPHRVCFQEIINSAAAAGKALQMQQEALRHRLQEQQHQKQREQDVLHQQRLNESMKTGYAPKPVGFAYYRVRGMGEKVKNGMKETHDLLKGFFCNSSDSGESEY